jgi:hypothetical protein
MSAIQSKPNFFDKSMSAERSAVKTSHTKVHWEKVDKTSQKESCSGPPSSGVLKCRNEPRGLTVKNC